MSYQVLARKWRPQNFAEVAGQAHVLKSLVNALDNGRLHHAYLFSGTRGVGKTTLARILAKCLNCEEGTKSTPCGKCGACSEISEGRFIDLIEVDAASRTKVEDTRELLENVQYLPAKGRFKVYLIDEVHMLSSHSFNALLKTLEEPPPHIKFLFATTDPQKLPVTILSRCLQLSLKNLSPQIIAEHLKKILIEESIEYDEEALWQIAASANGSMRDGLTLVDQGVSYCQGKLEASGIIDMLGIPKQKQIFAVLNAMVNRDIESLLGVLNKIADQSPDFNYTLEALLSTLHRVAVAQAVPGAIENSFGDKEKIKELAAKFSAEDIQLYYQIGTKGRDEIKYSADHSSAFEMLLLRMMIFSPSFSGAKAELSTRENQKKKIDLDYSEGDATKGVNEIPQFLDPGLSQDQELISSYQSIPSEMNHEVWLDLYGQLKINGIAANVLGNTEFRKRDGNTFYFVLNQEQSAIYNEDILPKLAYALSELLNEEILVDIEIGKVEKETPAMLMHRLKLKARKEMVDEFERDENVQEMLKHFSAELAIESILPIKE